MAGKTVADLEAMGDGEVTVTTIIREHFRRYAPSAHWMLYPDDVLILQGEQAALERVIARAKLKLATKEVAAAPVAGSEIGAVEAVIGAESPLVGRTAAQLALRARYQVNVVAVSRSGARLTQRLRAMRFRAGDVIVLQGDLDALPETLAELGCLPLASRGVSLGAGRNLWLPALVLAAAMLLVSLQLVPVSVGFFGAAVVLLLCRVADAARGLCRDRVADPDSAGGAHPGKRGAAQHRRDGPDRRLARDRGRPGAADGRSGADPGGRHGRHPLPQQRRHRADDGADRGRARDQSEAQPRPVPDGGRRRRRLRLPHARSATSATRW